MPHLDSDYVDELIARLERIPPDAVPRWGELRRDTLIAHLVWMVRHSMGRSRRVPCYGTPLTRYLLRPLAVYGVLPVSKNRRLPEALTAQGITDQEPGDIELLHALLEEYLNLVQADELEPAPHPLFGPPGVDGWERLHLRHFEHHCRQFGV